MRRFRSANMSHVWEVLESQAVRQTAGNSHHSTSNVTIETGLEWEPIAGHNADSTMAASFPCSSHKEMGHLAKEESSRHLAYQSRLAHVDAGQEPYRIPAGVHIPPAL